MNLDTTNVIAIQMEFPTWSGWAMNIGEQSWHGKSLGDLVRCIAENKLDKATFSISLLLPVELGQGAPIKQKE